MHESLDLDNLCALELEFVDVLFLKNNILIGLVLVTFSDVLVGDLLAALAALLVVTDPAVALLVQLVESDVLRRVNCVVDSNRNRYERETNVAFPY